MDSASVHHEVADLVRDHLSSTDHLELLVELAGRQDSVVTPEDAAVSLHSSPRAARAALDDLCASGLVRCDVQAGGIRCYRYAPASAALGNAVASLAAMYEERPMIVVRMIYSRPKSAVQSFADAFRIKREDD